MTAELLEKYAVGDCTLNSEYLDSEKSPIVIEFGSRYIKAGPASDDSPMFVFESLFGNPKESAKMVGVWEQGRDYLIGSAVVLRPASVIVRKIIENGVIENEDIFEKTLDYIFNEVCRVRSYEQPVFLIFKVEQPAAILERVTKLLIEYFQVPALYIAYSPELSLQAIGKITGTVCYMEEEVGYVASFREGKQISASVRYFDIKADDFADYLLKMVGEIGNGNPKEQKETSWHVCSKFAYVALDFEEEMKQNIQVPYYEESIDGSYNLGNELFRVTEAMFKPELMGKNILPIQQLVRDSIEACDEDIKAELYANVILAGEMTMFRGLDSRLLKEVKLLAPDAMKNVVNVFAAEDRNWAAWKTAAMLITKRI